MSDFGSYIRKVTRRSKRTVRRVLRKNHHQNGRRAASKSKRISLEFNPLKTAQDILDKNRTLVIHGNSIGVVFQNQDEKIFTAEQTKSIINEWHEMFHIAKKCTMLCDPLRTKLKELLFITQPIGLTDARIKEGGK